MCPFVSVVVGVVGGVQTSSASAPRDSLQGGNSDIKRNMQLAVKHKSKQSPNLGPQDSI